LHVPLRTSLYLELGMSADARDDAVDPDTVAVQIRAAGPEAAALLRTGQRFDTGVSGWLKPTQDLGGNKALAVYIEHGLALRPLTLYEVFVSARSKSGATLPADRGRWSFTTEAATSVEPVSLGIDLRTEPVQWHGAFFSGLCNVIFCSEAASYGPTYDLMAETHRRHPRAWSYQRDFWMTGTEFTKPGLLAQNLPNIVRERETRHITAIETAGSEQVLRVDDVFGHEQYGIAANRPLGDDYHQGDEVLIADGVHDAITKVIAVDDRAHTVRVAGVAAPAGGWKLVYDAPLPTRENPDAPGLFAFGGCYLRKFRPSGTPCYYWGRLDKEWDLVHRQGGRRVMVNFADAPGDLARDGRSWTTAKDLVEWHEVARTITGHLIDRYGAAALSFTWSVFNEPDLGPLFWRADWDELQRFYDYAVDGILRAFEDRGYDSDRVFVGGLELGGIFGTNLRLEEFLAHCSPRATAKGALTKNAAFADRKLDGLRSRRVEALCRAHDGKGTPCDFISIHSYNRSEMMAAKLAKAKEEALRIDPEFYRGLWINSHESCPDWMPPVDIAAADSYLGNGYFPTWCIDVCARQLRQAARDPRYGFGETILTVWPPVGNFTGLNAVTRMLTYQPEHPGAPRTTTVPSPIFHVLTRLADLSDRIWCLPTRQVGRHVVSGFASRADHVVRVVLYAHHPEDTQSRSDTSFDVSLDLDGLGFDSRVQVEEVRFDRDHNTYFQRGRALRDRGGITVKADPARVAQLGKSLGDRAPGVQRRALGALADLGPAAQAALPDVIRLAGATTDGAVRDAAQAAIRSIFVQPGYAETEVDEIRKLAQCRATGAANYAPAPDGRVRITARVAGNGVNFLTIVSGPK
jgi:hypothetical protein